LRVVLYGRQLAFTRFMAGFFVFGCAFKGRCPVEAIFLEDIVGLLGVDYGSVLDIDSAEEPPVFENHSGRAKRVRKNSSTNDL